MKQRQVIFLLFGIILLCTSCVQQEKGCTDPVALNYNPNAMQDNGECLYVLPVPSIYEFKRGNQNSVSYLPQIVLNLLIETICKTIEKTALPGATPIDIADLLEIYQQTDYNNNILSEVAPYSPSYSQFTQIASSQRLASNVINTYKADSMLMSWFDTIATRSQNSVFLGTPEVYTTSSGLNLKEAVRITLYTSVLMANSIQKVSNISSQSNSAFVYSKNYTPMENSWDSAFGFFGASVFYSLYTDEAWDAQPYHDYNGDLLIDFTTEYNFGFANLAVYRDLIDDADIDFTGVLFEAWTGGRTAITNQSDVLRSQFREIILSEWQRLIAASVVHHLNGLKSEMLYYGTPEQNIEQLNQDWSGLWMYLLSIKYFTNPEINVQNQLNLLGNSPVYAESGSTEYENYLIKLNQISAAIQQGYSFTDLQMQNW
ncbi:MAG: DUF4856 domain-containing protein [Sphingobacteriales bacterium]|nr:MAG: DUF4856 domain-containing protein [Sphingobacteriales bacterium]